jgi:cobalt-zinc-cadmium resistance protein CzcA
MQYHKFSVSIAAAEEDNTKLNVESKRSMLLHQYLSYKSELEYFRGSANEEALQIIKAANLSLKLGNIAPYEYLFSMSQAFDIQMKYLEAVKHYNESLEALKQVN